MKKKYHSVEEFASDLLLHFPEYYETVPLGFIANAVTAAIIERKGKFKSLQELHEYIQTEFI